ncbi:flagellar FlbD family protein [Anaerotignum propionicum]|uniref:Flagellar protein FlbD n=1 Tax=Anaerotignum propionicum DSM 1682 TaxID=991789 RepID=A0A0X8VB72_ANAPI|nr:flagellar FlbD family protein [Anaerotignum propionicum]AMJ42392.1 flagellar protein FlbD [Anaerotignum propionicum DSM 1682]MEA5058225.1 flagellar FlbD family protein [Anaerotignum propionicum]SHF01050.1 flagellar protein FlbD [[Clostridium] propionicum DSM 1682] [Anaerotignum propionicum DSM 1682]HBF64723.1 flagellar protein FlbD [Clostridium sp.]
MIKLTKLNGEKFVLNCEQIIAIESIPESKILLNNLSFYIVRETPDEIIEKSIKYLSAIHTMNLNQDA